MIKDFHDIRDYGTYPIEYCRPKRYGRRVLDSNDEEVLAKLPAAESCGAVFKISLCLMKYTFNNIPHMH